MRSYIIKVKTEMPEIPKKYIKLEEARILLPEHYSSL